jgi:hypothetical protein
MAILLPSTVAVFQLVLSYYVLELIYHKRCCLFGFHIESPLVSTLEFCETLTFLDYSSSSKTCIVTIGSNHRKVNFIPSTFPFPDFHLSYIISQFISFPKLYPSESVES